MNLFRRKKNDYEVFCEIAKLNSKHANFSIYRYHDDVANLIDRIIKSDENTVNMIFDDLLTRSSANVNKSTSFISYFEPAAYKKVKECIWLAFFKNGKLSNDRLLDILKNTSDRISMHYLCLPHETMTPVISYAIDKIDHLPLCAVHACVDVSKMPYFVLGELFPFCSHEVLADEKYNFFLEKMYNNNGVKFMLNNDMLSQEQLRCVCNNENLSDDVRNMAFSLLDDVYSVSKMTSHMKQSLYDASVSAMFEYNGVPYDFIREADMYLHNATANPESMLTEFMERDLLEYIYASDKSLRHPYVENLLLNGKNKRTFADIVTMTNNLCIDAVASAKCGKVSREIFSNLIFVIQNILESDRTVGKDHISAFRAIMKDDNFVANIPVHECGKLLSTCLEHLSVSFDILVILATAFCLPNPILETISEKCDGEAKLFADFHILLQTSAFNTDERKYLLRLLESIYFKEYDDNFLCEDVVTIADKRVYKETIAMDKKQFAFDVCNPIHYNVIFNAFNKMLDAPCYRYNTRARIALEAIRDNILVPFEDKFWHLKLKQDVNKVNYLVFKFYELQNLLNGCITETDYYIFVNAFGRKYLDMYEKISEKIVKEEIKQVPVMISNLFFES